MLDRLLNLLTTGGVRTPAELAARLDVTESMLDQLLADLSRMGYLRPVHSLTCHTSSNGHNPPKGYLGGCTDCTLSGICATDRPGGRVWMLTDKAYRQQGLG